MRSEVTWPTIPAMVRGTARGTTATRRPSSTARGGSTSRRCRSWSTTRRGRSWPSGIERGDRVAVWAPNSLEWIVAALGVTTAGGVLVPVNTRFRGRRGGVRARASGARALFTVRGFLDTDYPALLASAGVDAARARAHDPALGRADGRDRRLGRVPRRGDAR